MGTNRRRTVVSMATSYADQSEPQGDAEFVIPEDLASLTDEALATLHEEAVGHFDDTFGDGTGHTDEDMAVLAALTDGIETLSTEQARREGLAAERAEAAAALAARVRPEMAAETDDGTVEEEIDPADEAETPATEDEGAAEVVTASGNAKARRIPLSSRGSRNAPKPRKAEGTMRDVAYATGEGLGMGLNEPMDWSDAGKALDKRLTGFPLAHYQQAQMRGQHVREQHPFMAFKRPIPADLLVASGDPQAVADAMDRAVDFNRLPGKSLVAAGWCAPSEVMYDLCSNESRDGLYSIPEIGINRGGIKVPINPTFADIYSNMPGFHFTEEQAIAGEYAPGAAPGDPNVVGSKPCYEIECPEWEDYRLEGDGICIIGDLLQQRGYPEMQARVVSGALIAHDHRMSASTIQKVVNGSTPITMPAGQQGATAPLLSAIELQVEHYRYSQRLSRGTTLEAVFPYWVHSVVRQDLSVRLGLAEFAVSDATIDSWFRLRGVSPQFVYDWQALDTTAADAFTEWPNSVDFLLYQAGTWVRGVDDIITVETLYDSILLGQNKYTALFTEEASLVAKRCVDSRVITVNFSADGSTHAGILLEHNLTQTA